MFGRVVNMPVIYLLNFFVSSNISSRTFFELWKLKDMKLMLHQNTLFSSTSPQTAITNSAKRTPTGDVLQKKMFLKILGILQNS